MHAWCRGKDAAQGKHVLRPFYLCLLLLRAGVLLCLLLAAKQVSNPAEHGLLCRAMACEVCMGWEVGTAEMQTRPLLKGEHCMHNAGVLVAQGWKGGREEGKRTSQATPRREASAST